MPIIFTEDNKVIYECIACSKQYSKKSGIVTHTCKAPKPASVCPGCGRSFITARSLENHVCSKNTLSKVKAAKKKSHIYKCEFCEKKFVSQNLFEKHNCERKQRFLLRDEEWSRRGYKAYETFYKYSLNKNTPPSLMQFIKGKYYTTFIDFAKFTLDRDLFNWLEYEKYLIKHEVPSFKWNKQVTYDYFMKHFIKNETWDSAVERSVMWIMNWCLLNEYDPRDFFSTAPVPGIVLAIQTGRISPWVILLSKNAAAFLNRLSSEQSTIITRTIDESWKIKIAKDADAVYNVKLILEDTGI